MSLINYKDIDFNKSIDKTLKTFDFNGNEITVVPYLSISDKYDFIMITLQKSFDKGIYNQVKLDMYFDLHLVYMYTNINFVAEDRANEVDLYDTLKQSGLIDKVREYIGKEEIEDLDRLLINVRKEMSDYKGSLLSFISDIIYTLPEKAEKALEMFKNIDPEILKKFSNGSLSNLMTILEN